MTSGLRGPCLRLQNRRSIVAAAPFVIAGGLSFVSGPASAKEKKGEEAESVTPPEDLMREHGVLDRVLLIYEAGVRKLADGAEFDPAHFVDAAKIIRTFIEDYHEKSEEQAVFPRFKKAGQMVGLVNTLIEQHEAGRRVTDVILREAPGSSNDREARRKTVAAIAAFIAMYRPHAAREDTALFPRLRQLVSSNEYDAMAEDFENKEHRLFGEDGFEHMVERVARIEKALGIYELDRFTPRS